MRKSIILILLIAVFTHCKKEENLVCGCNDPVTELQWLKELIQKAESDTTEIYSGRIYLEEYNGEDVFFTTMMLESAGHVINRWFDCSGNNVLFEPDEKKPQPKMNNLIYSNIK